MKQQTRIILILVLAISMLFASCSFTPSERNEIPLDSIIPKDTQDYLKDTFLQIFEGYAGGTGTLKSELESEIINTITSEKGTLVLSIFYNDLLTDKDLMGEIKDTNGKVIGNWGEKLRNDLLVSKFESDDGLPFVFFKNDVISKYFNRDLQKYLKEVMKGCLNGEEYTKNLKDLKTKFEQDLKALTDNLKNIEKEKAEKFEAYKKELEQKTAANGGVAPIGMPTIEQKKNDLDREYKNQLATANYQITECIEDYSEEKGRQIFTNSLTIAPALRKKVIEEYKKEYKDKPFEINDLIDAKLSDLKEGDKVVGDDITLEEFSLSNFASTLKDILSEPVFLAKEVVNTQTKKAEVVAAEGTFREYIDSILKKAEMKLDIDRLLNSIENEEISIENSYFKCRMLDLYKPMTYKEFKELEGKNLGDMCINVKVGGYNLAFKNTADIGKKLYANHSGDLVSMVGKPEAERNAATYTLVDNLDYNYSIYTNKKDPSRFFAELGRTLFKIVGSNIKNITSLPWLKP